MRNHQTKRTPIFSFYDDETPESLEFQRLYSKLRHLKVDSRLQHLIVTSSMMGEGKSTTAALLAITIAKFQPANTLLVDFDLRNPKIHQLFELEQKAGVAEIIEGKLSAKACFKSTPVPNLSVLTSGELTIPYIEAFRSNVLKNFFDEIKFFYDIIIVDTAPVIPVSDALILSVETQGVLFVVKAGKTPRDVAKRARDLMTDAGVNILGVVVNNAEDVLPYYYSHRYYGYGYYGKKADA